MKYTENKNNESDYYNRSVAARKSTLVSVVVNIFLSCFQVLPGIFSGSQGLIADGMHSFSDLVADFVVLIANKKSRKSSDDDHHYGHGRYENGASLVIGATLFVAGATMVWSASGKLRHPETIADVHIVALWTVLFALAAKELLFRYMMAVATRIRSSLLIANAWHARSHQKQTVLPDMVMTAFLRKTGVISDATGRLVTAHGFRSSFREAVSRGRGAVMWQSGPGALAEK